MEENVEKAVKGFAAHFTKAAAFHKAHGEAHEQAAEAHDTMAEACKAMHEHHEGKVAKADGTQDDEHKAHSVMHKAMHAFHKSMSKVHGMMHKAHMAHSEHCAMCAKAAPDTFSTSVSGEEHSGEKVAKTAEELAVEKAAADKLAAEKAAKGDKSQAELLLEKMDSFGKRFDKMEEALTKLENSPEALPAGLSLVPRVPNTGGISKAQPAAEDETGGLRKRG